MEFTDYYSTLGVSKTATEDEIQKAYRKLARQYHPDVNKNAGAENRFKEIGEAHDVLKDPEKRSRYDRYGAAWKQMEQSGRGVGDFGFGSAGPAGFDSFYDVLEHLFGNSAGAGFSSDAGAENAAAGSQRAQRGAVKAHRGPGNVPVEQRGGGWDHNAASAAGAIGNNCGYVV